MVFHSSSASLSSLSLSHTSTHTASTSSSHSSPPSSPDSASNNSLSTQQRHHSASPRRHRSIVPFSWEEKPGVLKKKIMQARHLDECCGTPAFFCQDVEELDACAYIAGDENLQPSYKHARTCATHEMPKTACASEGLPRIRPPPCLSHPELHANTVEGGEFSTLQSSHPHHYHQAGGASAAAVGSKFMASLSLHKRRHHRSTPSLEDDPFWLAMVACTHDADKGVPIRRKGPKAFLTREISRTDSWLARRVQESIHLDQCMPRQGAVENHSISRKVLHSTGRGQEKTCDQFRYDDEEALNSVKFSSSKVHHANAGNVNHHNAEENEAIHSARLARKAIKALSMARVELQGRCKELWQQQAGPPVVDISCSSRRRLKAKGGGVASKHKLPDLFGCKSSPPLFVTSRFS